MSNFVNTIDLLGDQATADAIVSRKITEFKDDALTKIGENRFADCTQLTTVDLPNVETLGFAVFSGCSALSSVNLLTLTAVPRSCFSGCKKLKLCDLPKATQIISQAFESSGLEILILRSSAVCTLDSVSAFPSKSVTVYVPYDFIDAYENATNWSSLVANGRVFFEALEGSGYD
jgi:hypothetical protein